MSLPYELLLRVFYLLTPRDVCKCRRVCTAWRDISCDPSIWRNFYARFARTFVDVPLMPVATAENEDGYQQDTIDWEERYTFLRTRETKWRKGRPQYTHVWKAHAFPIRCLVLSDHTLVTATDFTLRAWDLSVPLQHAGEVPGFVEREMERVLQYLNVARNRGTLFVTFAVVGLIHMYDLKTLDHKGILNISEPISFVTVANDLDEYIVVVTFGGLVKVFDPSDGTVLFMMHNGFTATHAALYSPNLLLISSSTHTMYLTIHTLTRTPASALIISADFPRPLLWSSHRTNLYAVSGCSLTHYPLLPTGIPCRDREDAQRPFARRECHLPGEIVAVACGGSRGRAAVVVEKEAKEFHLYVYDPREGVVGVAGVRMMGGLGDTWPVVVDEERIVVGRRRGEVVVCGFGMRR